MNKMRALRGLCLILALLLIPWAVAEELQVDAFEDEVMPAAVGTDLLPDDQVTAFTGPLPNDAAQPADGQEVTEPSQTGDGESEGAQAPDPIGIKVKKDLSKKVYLGIDYVLKVKGGIKRVKSGANKIATASKDGVVTLKKTGKAKLTVTSLTGEVYAVTLNVKAAPAPSKPILKIGNAMTLSWRAAKYATGYVVQISPDGKAWADCLTVSSDTTSADVTEAVTGTAWLRVVSVLGDHLGGASQAVEVLTPVSDVRVICRESTPRGPFDMLNIIWEASPDATAYEVWHACLPSGDYKLLGTTDELWYPAIRSQTQLDAFKVRPVFADFAGDFSKPVTLWSGYESNVLPPAKLTSSTGILLLVNKKAQVVTAYIRDADGRYTLPLRHMICSTGKVYERTKNGTFKIKGHLNEWYRYPSGTYIRWPSIYRSGYYFHSVLYSSKDSISTSTVRKLGTRQSQGCVRLKVRDAEWLYKNCGKGTTVYICDGAKRDKLKKALLPKHVEVLGFD